MSVELLEKYFQNPYFTLFQKQKEVIYDLLMKQYVLLHGEQGSGKTSIIIFLLKILLEKGLVNRVFIVTKNEVAPKFKTSILQFMDWLQPDEVVLYDDSNRDMFVSTGKIFICDYDQVKTLYYHLHPEVNPRLKVNQKGKKKRKYYKQKFPITDEWAVVLDECQAGKSVKSDVHKILVKNISKAKFCIGSSGTPMEKIEEVYAIFRMLDPKIIGHNYNSFMNTIASLVPGTYRVEYYLEEGVKTIWDRIGDHIIKIRKKDMKELPTKTVEDLCVEMDPDTEMDYKYFTKKLTSELNEADYWNRKTIATLIHPIFEYVRRVDPANPRFRMLESLIRRFSPTEKLIVWDESPAILDQLNDYFNEAGIPSLKIHGATVKAKRGEIIDQFDKDPETRVLFVSYLTNQDAWEIPSREDCNKMIYYKLPDRAIAYLQSSDREHRMSSTFPATIFRILMNGTIDDWARELLDYKIAVMEGAMTEADFQKVEQQSYARTFGVRPRKIVNK